VPQHQDTGLPIAPSRRCHHPDIAQSRSSWTPPP